MTVTPCYSLMHNLSRDENRCEAPTYFGAPWIHSLGETLADFAARGFQLDELIEVTLLLPMVFIIAWEVL